MKFGLFGGARARGGPAGDSDDSKESVELKRVRRLD